LRISGKTNRNWWIRQQTFGRTSKNEFPKWGVTERSHPKKVGGARSCLHLKSLADRATRRVDLLKDDINAVSREVLGEFFRRILAIETLLINHRHDPDSPCLLQNWDGIGNCTRRSAAEITLRYR